LRLVTTPTPPQRALLSGRLLVEGLRTHRAFEAAAAVAFWFFLSVVPLLVLLGFAVGQVARSRGIDALLAPMLEVIPRTAEGVVRNELERLAGRGSSSLAPLGVASFLWTASSGLHNLMDVLEAPGGVAPRPWWKKRAISLAWVLFGLAAACALAWVLVRLDAATQRPPPIPSAALRGALRRHLHKPLDAAWARAAASALMLAVGMAFLAGFYRSAVERPPNVRRRVWPGTLVAVASWFVVSWAFGAYAVSIADYAVYYGSLAAVAVMLVWLYLTSLVLVIGAEVNALVEGGRRPAPAATPPGARRRRQL
jgi:membrane protein